jgi:hypothetical protein
MPPVHHFELRLATLQDVATLETLIAMSARALAKDDYSAQQIEAAIGSAWGVDTQLILDATYFVAQAGEDIVGCGGWSQRRTLFGADEQSDRDDSRLTPGLARQRCEPSLSGRSGQDEASDDCFLNAVNMRHAKPGSPRLSSWLRYLEYASMHPWATLAISVSRSHFRVA